MVKITGKILNVSFLIVAVWRKTISELIHLHERFHNNVCRKKYSDILRNYQVI